MESPPAILHVFAEHPESLVRAVCRYAAVQDAVAEEWIRSGAVYCDGARAKEDRSLRGGEYLRIHRRPRRFAEADRVDWSRVVVASEPEFHVVDKPAGVPIHPTLDNAHENVLARLERETGERLFVTQRLDLPTEGLCVVARTKAFQSEFNRLLADGGVEKRYRAIARGAPPLGRHRAWQEPSDRAPKTMASDARPGWKECSLVVEAVERWNEGNSVAVVRLETGRTHQIRGQLALLGHPLVGDALYGGGENVGPLRLQSAELAFRRLGRDYRWTLPWPAWPREASGALTGDDGK